MIEEDSESELSSENRVIKCITPSDLNQTTSTKSSTCFRFNRKFIDKNDLIAVLSDGANIPEKYSGLIDAFGKISMGCTATHVGDGLVLTAEYSDNRDYAIFRVDRIPARKVEFDLQARPTIGTALTNFGHPQARPLECLQTCILEAASRGVSGTDHFSH